MKLHRVFYAGLLYGEYGTFPLAHEGPDGAYLFTKSGNWYVLQHGSWTPINLSVVPKELRTYMLLLT